MNLMDDLYEHICKKATHGIPYVDAVQFMLWTFITLEFIPKEFRVLELSKVNLAILFAALAAKRKVIVSPTDNLSVDDLVRPDHWEKLVDDLLLRKIALDESFPPRFKLYI